MTELVKDQFSCSVVCNPVDCSKVKDMKEKSVLEVTNY